jgi:hypothetical protein
MTAPVSSGLRSFLHGLWLPLITPFRDAIGKALANFIGRSIKSALTPTSF